MWKYISLAVLLVLLLAWVAWGYYIVKDIEEPVYSIVEESGSFEIREYESYLLAETVVDGEYREAMDGGFQILAGYIFGKNKVQKSIPMTAPVTMLEATPGESVKLPMTAPVVQEEVESGQRIGFVMPSEYSLETLPEPVDDRIEFRVVAPRTMAAITFRGFASEGTVADKKRELMEALSERGLTAQSTIELAQYDPPWSPPWMRRNEVMVEIAPQESADVTAVTTEE